MTFYDNWSTTPSENNAAPPLGGGEGKMTVDQITDTFRVVMSAIKELATGTTGIIKSMAFQAKEAVDITGGTIGANVSIAAEALKSGLIDLARLPTSLTGKIADGLTPAGMQNMYNLVHPVGQILLWHNNDPVASSLIWPGVTATWTEIISARDYSVVIHGTQTPLANGAGSIALNSNVGLAGNHQHGVQVLNTNAPGLTRNQVPANTFTTVMAQIAGTAEVVRSDLNHAGGSVEGHSHSIAAHATDAMSIITPHTTLFDPLRFAFTLWQRTA